MDFTVIATPGHSKGSVCYRVDDKIFVGDTLFFESVGRWDLPTGNGNQLLISIKKLYAIPGNFTLYCGHGEESTLEHERKNNPYVRM